MSLYKQFLVSVLLTIVFLVLFIGIIPTYVEKPVFIPGFAPGPAVWPNTIAIVGILVGIVLMLATFPRFRNRKNYHEREEETGGSGESGLLFQRCCVSLVILVGYIYLVPVAGIIVASMLWLGVLFFFIGIKEKMRWMVGLTLVFPLAIFLLFTRVTHTVFPAGFLWEKIGLF
ncbi:MAG: hypothetical protein CR981_01920 [Proteobacteria bacterium]|nr:MAG: hypothetical protein CR981_01920 [Pseudomonadota bacterium]